MESQFTSIENDWQKAMLDRIFKLSSGNVEKFENTSVLDKHSILSDKLKQSFKEELKNINDYAKVSKDEVEFLKKGFELAFEYDSYPLFVYILYLTYNSFDTVTDGANKHSKSGTIPESYRNLIRDCLAEFEKDRSTLTEALINEIILDLNS